MRKWFMVGLLAVPLVAAADDRGSTKEESREAAQSARDDMKQAGQDAKEKTHAAGRDAREDMHRASADQKKQRPFADAHNFDVKGKVQKVSKDSITIRRDEDKLPPAKLGVDHQTKIEVDGQQASWSKVQQGADVKASFNLRNDKPVAVEIKAEKTDAQKQHEDRAKQQR
jgi:hypothetical protein